MKSRAVNTTKEQDEYRYAILRRKPPVKKERQKKQFVAPPSTTREQYMKNCIYWINEYLENGGDIHRALKASISLKQHCEQIISELNKQPN